MYDGDRDSQPSAGTIERSSVLRTYRWYAPYYDRVFGALLNAGRTELAREVAEFAPARLLEVGVGTGLLLPLYPPATAVAGIDLSPAMLQRAARASSRPVAPLLLQGDAEHLPFADACFDCVTLPYVVSVTPDPARLLREAERVCRPDGDILVLGHFGGYSGGGWGLLERALAPLASLLGFRSNLPLDDFLSLTQWHPVAVRSTNLFGLFRLIHLRRSAS